MLKLAWFMSLCLCWELMWSCECIGLPSGLSGRLHRAWGAQTLEGLSAPFLCRYLLRAGYLPRPLEGAVVWRRTTMAAPIGKGRICIWNRLGLCLWPDFHINNFQHIWPERVLWATEGRYSTSVLWGIINSGDQSRCFQGDLRTFTAGFVANETGSYFKRNTVFSQQTKHFLC